MFVGQTPRTLAEAVGTGLLRAAAAVRGRAQVAPHVASLDTEHARLVVPQQTITAGTRMHILDAHGAVAFTLDMGTHTRAGLILKSVHDGEIRRIHVPADISATLDIEGPDGGIAAIVHNALLSPLRQRWRIDVPAGRQLLATGNVFQHEYTITDRNGAPAALVSKWWSRRRDAYGVDLLAGADVLTTVAVVLAIDVLSLAGGAGASPHRRVQPAQATRT